jgi:hypothetical protein
MPRRRAVARVTPDPALLARRDETIGAVYEYLRERLPQYLWSALEVAVSGWPPHVAFGGSHCELERFVCLTIDRRVIDCAGDEPAALVRRLYLARVEVELEEGDATRPVLVELD